MKGRVIRYKPVAKLSGKVGAKSAVKKGGMKGGMFDEILDVTKEDKESILIASITYYPSIINASNSKKIITNQKLIDALHELTTSDNIYIKKINNGKSYLFNIYLKKFLPQSLEAQSLEAQGLKVLLSNDPKAIETIKKLKELYTYCRELSRYMFSFQINIEEYDTNGVPEELVKIIKGDTQ